MCVENEKLSMIKSSHCSKVDVQRLRLHTDSTGPLTSSCSLMVRTRNDQKFVKIGGKKSTSLTVNRLQRFDIRDKAESDNGTKFMSSKFLKFCETFAVELN